MELVKLPVLLPLPPSFLVSCVCVMLAVSSMLPAGSCSVQSLSTHSASFCCCSWELPLLAEGSTSLPEKRQIKFVSFFIWIAEHFLWGCPMWPFSFQIFVPKTVVIWTVLHYILIATYRRFRSAHRFFPQGCRQPATSRGWGWLTMHFIWSILLCSILHTTTEPRK